MLCAVKSFLRNAPTWLSIAMGVIEVLLAAHSYRHADRWEFSTLRAHYTVWSIGGKVVVMGPPPAVWSSEEARAWDSLKRLENRQFRFVVTAGGAGTNVIEAQPVAGSAAADLAALPRQAIIRPLLRGLDGSKKFAAAEMFLEEDVSTSDAVATQITSETNVLFGGYRLRIPVHPSNDATESGANIGSKIVIGFAGEDPPQVDPAGRVVFRRHWHDRLDVEVFRLGYVWLVLGALPLPILRGVRFIKARWRRGDQLTASTGGRS